MPLVETFAVVRELAAANLGAAAELDLQEPVGVGEALPRGGHDVGLAGGQDGLGLGEVVDATRGHDRRGEAGLATPIVAAGGICEFTQAEELLARGEADLVASARQSLADPDWFLKIREGRGAEVRRCEFTNYCEALDQQHKQVTCKLWDRDELDEPNVRLADDGKRRLVAPRWRR